MWERIATHITEITGTPFVVRTQRACGGGCINGATVVGDGSRQYFVKHNAATGLAMFEAEADGLRELAQARAVRVPQPVCAGTAGDNAYLVLEYLDLGGDAEQAGAAFGHALARLHQCHGTQFGWRRDNTIGSTAQINAPCASWSEFWRDRRLHFQLRLAADNGYRGALLRKTERLLADVDVFFRDHRPAPSLLHGDLWSGNYAADDAGEPVIFDPAVYYGDRETDIAMTELFGGFPRRFYDAYRDALPLDAGYRVRKTLYNLYHVLNHLNLFGGGYSAQAERMVDQLLAEIR